jgi:triosephosphate isomerase
LSLLSSPTLLSFRVPLLRLVLTSATEVVIAPPSLFLLLARDHLKEGLEVASQNVFDKPNGAFTGEISVAQLKESGITWSLVGHSERRVLLQEDDAVCLDMSRLQDCC